MTFSICIKCGTAKKQPISQCPVCHFKPKSNDDKAKSLILSLDYEIDGEYRGKTKEELQEIASLIRDGVPYAFDEREVKSVIAYAQETLSIPPRRLIIDGIKWLGPPLLIFVAMYLLLSKWWE